jgi:DNA polymerase-3 subunit gamma/tau
MSYLVLARKYRPKTFTELVGQPHVVQALTNALTRQRLHHAYLFTGTRGVGKTTVSRILAKSLNCEKGITPEPCGLCENCLAIDVGRFVDYTELDAASNRGVEEVQNLIEQAVYKPVTGRFKVFMIDEVHMLSPHAFNAILKTLEEPPEYLKFVLATTDPQKVPVTVLSRCLQFNLRPMAPETILEHLEHVLGLEKIGAQKSALFTLARAARGSMRDALSLTDQAIAYTGAEIKDEEVRQMLGSVDKDHVFGLIEALSKGSGQEVIEICDQLRDQGLSASQALEDISYVLQRMAVFQFSQAKAQGLSEIDTEVTRTKSLSELMPKDETQLLYSICLKGRSEIGLAPDEYAGLTMVLLRLLAFKDEDTDPLHADHAQAVDAQEAQKKTLETVKNSLQERAAKPQAPPTAAVNPMPPSTANGHSVGPAQALALALAQVPAQVPAQAQAINSLERRAPAAKPLVSLDSSIEDASSSGAGFNLPVRDMAHRSKPSSLNAPEGLVHDDEHEDAHAVESISDVDRWREESEGTSAQTALSKSTPVEQVQWVQQAPSNAVQVAVRVASQNADVGVSDPKDHFKTKLKPTQEGDDWLCVVQQLIQAELVQSLARELALQSQLIAKESDSWLLRIERESLKTVSSVERLAKALSQLGHEVELRFELAPVQDCPGMRLAQIAFEKQQIAESKILNDPFVIQMMQEFDAKIVPGSIKTI